MRKNDFRPRGVYKKKIRYLVDGVIIGSKIQIEEKIADLKTAVRNFYYKRKKLASEHFAGDFTLKNQKRF
jgi:hypothetical protein